MEESISDPVLLKLKSAAGRAVNRLVSEIDGVGEDSNPSTRLKAATSVLDRLGYGEKKDDSNAPNIIFVSLSSGKLSSITNKKSIVPQPDTIQG